MSIYQSTKIETRDSMEISAVTAPSQHLLFESFKRAIVMLLAVFAAVLSICAFTGEQAEAKTYTGDLGDACYHERRMGQPVHVHLGHHRLR